MGVQQWEGVTSQCEVAEREVQHRQVGQPTVPVMVVVDPHYRVRLATWQDLVEHHAHVLVVEKRREEEIAP